MWVAAGFMVALTVTFGSGFRPIGGWVADRIGGVKSLIAIFSVVAIAYFTVAYLPPGPASATGFWTLLQIPDVAWIAVACFSTGMIALGMGTGQFSN